jgi:hypothetical protein
MFLANTKTWLKREDAQLAIVLIARGSGDERQQAEERLRDGGIDALLDDPRLVGALLENPLGARASLPLFCCAIVRQAMRNVGEPDHQLADYVAAVLVQFGMHGRAQRVAEHDDEDYDTLADLVAAMDGPDPRRNLLVRMHLGNRLLWLSGLFPDWIEHRKWRRGGPDVEYYDDMGMRGFRLAADHRLAEEHGLSPLFRSAADRFVSLRLALNSISDTLLFPHRNTPERVMRQVRSEWRWKLAH